mmetsp:Transcript_40564/g.102007  ORF Transcript_40564/g.102007 Transcript_40564/m.102007 type:complete len:309 (+) Transcript_40564:182-1108(+)
MAVLRFGCASASWRRSASCQRARAARHTAVRRGAHVVARKLRRAAHMLDVDGARRLQLLRRSHGQGGERGGGLGRGRAWAPLRGPGAARVSARVGRQRGGCHLGARRHAVAAARERLLAAAQLLEALQVLLGNQEGGQDVVHGSLRLPRRLLQQLPASERHAGNTLRLQPEAVHLQLVRLALRRRELLLRARLGRQQRGHLAAAEPALDYQRRPVPLRLRLLHCRCLALGALQLRDARLELGGPRRRGAAHRLQLPLHRRLRLGALRPDGRFVLLHRGRHLPQPLLQVLVGAQQQPLLHRHLAVILLQ